MDWNQQPRTTPSPDFNHLLAVLKRREPERPTLFEFFLNERLFDRMVPEYPSNPDDPRVHIRRSIHAFHRLGYDFTTVMVPGFNFADGIVIRRHEKSVSLNEGSVLHTWRDFESFRWADPELAHFDLLEEMGKELPDGMKMIVYSPDGVFENVVDLVGYENLCLMIADDPVLAGAIFDKVGERLLRYFELAVQYDGIGAVFGNDDWGFKTHTLLSPADLRRFVFPWYKKINEMVHAAGKPVILHSCGHFTRILDDIVDEMKFDARHSYEDTILPVEEAYERFHERIAILGGIDVDFVCRASPEEVYARSRAMLERSAGRGGYALGTGNSVPDYVPDSGYFAMIRAALDMRY